MDDGTFYQVVLDAAAVDRGEQIICSIVAGTAEVVQVRVIESTAPLYRVGTSGVVLRKRLVPAEQ